MKFFTLKNGDVKYSNTSFTKNRRVCSGVTFVQCAWCKSTLCFVCFFDNYHLEMCEAHE